MTVVHLLGKNFPRKNKMSKSPFKSLNIDRDRIPAVLEGCGATDISFAEASKTETHLSGSYKGAQFFIRIYTTKQGTTTLGKATGRGENFEELAEIIKQGCIYSTQTQFNYTIPSITKESVAFLLSFIEEQGITITEDTSSEDRNCEKQYIFSTDDGDRIRVKIYRRGSIQFQGRYLKIASAINDFMCSILNISEIVEQKNKEFNVSIKEETIEEELHSRLPNSIDVIHDTIKKQLSCSIIMKKISMDMEDYATYCFSALRATEGFMYQILATHCNCTPTKSSGVGDYFEREHQGAPYKVRAIYDDAINGDPASILCECYTYWHENRHGLFHMKPGLSDTRTIDRESSIKIIDDVCNLIDTSIARLKK